REPMARVHSTDNLAALILGVLSLFLATSTTTAGEPQEGLRETTRSKQIRIRSKLYEVDRAKMRKLGFDFATAECIWIENKPAESTLSFGFASCDGEKFAMLGALCENRLARILSEPTVTVADGGSVSLSSGSTVEMPTHEKQDGTPRGEFIGSKADIKATIVNDKTVRVKLHVSCNTLEETSTKWWSSASKVRHQEIEAEFEAQLGETFVVEGALGKEQMGDDVCDTLLVLVVTPELVDGKRVRGARVSLATPTLPNDGAQEPKVLRR
ncbi:hypothetical protein OAS39_07825, partial [Pirellulales bacterium]|nr:hypothetical protein [Pirellulales bacterium]